MYNISIVYKKLHMINIIIEKKKEKWQKRKCCIYT